VAFGVLVTKGKDHINRVNYFVYLLFPISHCRVICFVYITYISLSLSTIFCTLIVLASSLLVLYHLYPIVMNQLCIELLLLKDYSIKNCQYRFQFHCVTVAEAERGRV
jgi:hypothetical protein